VLPLDAELPNAELLGAVPNADPVLLEGILVDEEESVDWLEAQLHIIEEIGKEQYLAEQIHD